MSNKYNPTTSAAMVGVPDWMNQEALQTLSKGYLKEGETPLDMWKRVSKATAKYLRMPSIEEDLLECLYNGYIGLSTPVAANFGRKGSHNGLPVSCFANHVSDNIHSIYSHLKESAALSKYGGGTASYYGDVRHAGAPISGGGVSSGLAPWLRQSDLAASVVTQGNTRRGSTALYLPIDHPDLPEVLRAKDHTKGDPRQFIDSNIAVTITNEWIEGLRRGDSDKKKLFDEILKIRMTSGSPYLIFIDNANDKNPEAYLLNNLSVKTSNLCCLTGDTLVETRGGSALIKNLVGREVEIYDGKEWVLNSGFVEVAESAQVFSILLNTGSSVRATHNHKWYVKDAHNNYVQKFTTELVRGDVLQPASCFEWELLGDIKVLSVQELDVPEPVYCTEVETTHKFALSCGVMTGNSEIFLHTDEDHTFVCVLSSLNMLKYPEWKTYVGRNTGLSVPELAIYLLDAVVDEFISKASTLQSMGRAVRFAKKSRALGLGTMGCAALYQRLNIPFESAEARRINIEAHKLIKEKADKASRTLAKLYGEPEWCKGTGFRHTHRIAIAPTKSNSVICGAVSQGVEPIESNYYMAKQAKGTFMRRNPFLEKALEALGKNTQEVWSSIVSSKGSVQHLTFLDAKTRAVFKTAREIDQFEILFQAADRQEFVCQGQSINLFVTSDCSAEYLYKLHLTAWNLGLKSLYYLKAKSALVKSKHDLATIVTTDTCPYCAKAKQFLEELEIPYIEISKREAITKGIWENRMTTVPQIWYNKEYIGGYTELTQKFSESVQTINECEACHA
jgi:ribonucleotide reductase alpha subunit